MTEPYFCTRVNNNAHVQPWIEKLHENNYKPLGLHFYLFENYLCHIMHLLYSIMLMPNKSVFENFIFVGPTDTYGTFNIMIKVSKLKIPTNWSRLMVLYEWLKTTIIAWKPRMTLSNYLYQRDRTWITPIRILQFFLNN